MRASAELSKRVVELGKRDISFVGIDCLPLDIQAGLENGWQDSAVRHFFTRHSEVCRILFKNPADFEMLEIAYFGEPVRGQAVSNGIDKWLSGSLSGQALRDRLRVVSGWVARWLTQQLATGRSVRVLDLGAGPGPYAFEAISQAVIPDRSQLLWECIDIDRLALDIGEERAAAKDLAKVVMFREADFLSRSSYPVSDEVKADFGLMIGILCGMTMDQATSCLKRVVPHFKPGAEFLAATLLVKSFKEDPQVFRVFCNVLGWQLQPKTLPEVREVFTQAGYEILDIFSERENGDGQYAIVHAKVPCF